MGTYDQWKIIGPIVCIITYFIWWHDGDWWSESMRVRRGISIGKIWKKKSFKKCKW